MQDRTTKLRSALRLPLERWLLIGGVAAALLLPAVVFQRDLSLSPVMFRDQVSHLLRLDHSLKAGVMDPGLYREPWLRQELAVAQVKWPDGVYAVARPWAAAFGLLSVRTAWITNLLFSLVLALAVVGLGRAARDAGLGLWALLLCLLSPPLLAGRQVFNLDYPQVAMVTGGLLALWHTRGFSILPASLLLGLWSGLGLFVKPTYALYLAAPALWCLVQGLRRGPWRRVALHALGAGLITAALAVTLLDLRWSTFVQPLLDHLRAGETPASRQFAAGTPAWLLAYPLFALLAFPQALLALPGLVGLHLRRAHPARGLWLALLWGSYLLLTLLPAKLERYLHPTYPVLCLALVWGAYRWLPRWWRPAALSAVAALFFAIALLQPQHGTPWLVSQDRLYDALPLRGWLGLPSREEFNGRFELSAPPADMLEGLRRLRYHPDCDLRALVPELARVARQGPADRIILVQALDRAQLPADLPGPRLQNDLLTLYCSHAVRDRLFYYFDELEFLRQLWRHAARPPDVLAVHLQPRDWPTLLPGSRVLARGQAPATCGQRREYQITLLRAGGPAPR